MIRFQCPQCGAKLQVSEAYAGKKGRCPQCKGGTTVPPTPATMPSVTARKADPAADAPRNALDGTLLDLSRPSTEPTSQPSEAADGGTPSERGITRSVLGILLYPVNISGVIHLLIFSFLPPLWIQALSLRFWMSPGIGPLFCLVLLTLYFLHYAALCLSDSAQGATRAADINGDSTPLSVDALLSTFQTFFPAVALIWGPAFVYYLVKERMDWILMAWLAVAGLTFPMAILAVNYFDSFRGANPVLVLSSIASVPGPYGGLVVCLSALTALVAVLMYLSGGTHGGYIIRLLIIYGLLMESHLLGRFYRRYQDRLNWGI